MRVQRDKLLVVDKVVRTRKGAQKWRRAIKAAVVAEAVEVAEAAAAAVEAAAAAVEAAAAAAEKAAAA